MFRLRPEMQLQYLPNTVSSIFISSLTKANWTIYIRDGRLDFETFDIADPDATAGTPTAGTATQCLTDVFVVSGQTNNVPGICGYNQGQHSKENGEQVANWREAQPFVPEWTPDYTPLF